MLTEQQIAEFTRRARLAGLTDDQIRQEIEKKAREFGGTTSPLAQTTTTMGTVSAPSAPPKTQTQVGDVTGGESGGFIVNFIKNLVQPAVQPAIEYGKFFGEAGYQASRFAFDPLFRKAVLGEKLTPEEEKKLASQKATFFYSEEEAQRKLSDRGKIAETGLKATAKFGAEAASFFVPFGKGTSLMSKVFIPGFKSGALFEASQEGATPKSVLESGAAGALSAGIIHGIGGMLSWVKGKNGEIIRQSEKLAESTRKIKVKPSVFGAKQEQAINETLNKYGFKGSAQKQYEMLEPTLNKIEEKIQKIIQENPDLSVSVDKIKDAFMNNLKSSLRTRDLTQKQAINEINGYLNDLLMAAKGAEGATGRVKEIPLSTLREMKKILNQDYASVFKKIENGTSLNPREKVIAAAWDSLDEAIKDVSPEIKELLLDESNLYRAAQPLASARFNPPTFRVAGTSVPASLTQKLRDWGQAILKGIGIGLEKIPNEVPIKKYDVEKFQSLAAVAALNKRGLSDSDIQKVEELKQNLLPTTTPVEEQITNSLSNKPTPLNPFGGLTKRQVLALALTNGASTKDLEEVGKIYDMLASDESVVSEENMKIADTLRTEYFKRTQENGWLDVVTAYKKIATAGESAQGDMALIYGYIKLLDRNTGVKEGEYATAENAPNIPEQVRQLYNRTIKGRRLTPAQRTGFIREAQNIFQVHQQQQAPIDAYYQGLAQRYGIDPSLIGVGLYR